MNRIEQINELFSGGLTDSEISELFSVMAGDEELRRVFNNFTKVDSIIKENSAPVIPPPALKTAVFNQIGIKTSTAPISTNWKTRLFSKTGLVATNIVTLAVVVLLLIRLWGNDVDTQSLASNNSANDLNLAIVESNTQAETIEEKEVEMKKEVKIKYVPVLLSNTENINSGGANSSHVIHSDFAISEYKKTANTSYPFENLKLANDSKNHTNQNLNQINYEPLPYTMNEKLYNNIFSKLRFELHNERVEMIDDVTVQPKDRSNFDKMQFSLIYDYSLSRSFGFNLKQETFYLDFIGKSLNGLDYKYVMQPNLTAYELFWREKFLTQYDLHPYTNLSLGFNKVGITIKPGFGLEYKPGHNIALLLGCESASLFYEREGKYFDSHKLAVYYGVSIGF